LARLQWISADFEHQLALQMARFTDPVSLRGVGKFITSDCGRPNRTGIEKSQHSHEMGAVANDVGA
jgi:hypothetical protein